jgi:uncharacterized iron-regulated membrane protein
MSQSAHWLRHPQQLWLRRAVFQIHLWSGIILGTYVSLVCASGSAVIFRNDLYDLLFAKTKVQVSGKPLSNQQLTEAAERAYPGYTVQTIHRGRFPTESTDILLVNGWRHKDRLFDPYVGRDIGGSVEVYYPAGPWIFLTTCCTGQASSTAIFCSDRRGCRRTVSADSLPP